MPAATPEAIVGERVRHAKYAASTVQNVAGTSLIGCSAMSTNTGLVASSTAASRAAIAPVRARTRSARHSTAATPRTGGTKNGADAPAIARTAARTIGNPGANLGPILNRT